MYIMVITYAPATPLTVHSIVDTHYGLRYGWADAQRSKNCYIKFRY